MLTEGEAETAGQVKVMPEVTYTPDGGTPNTEQEGKAREAVGPRGRRA
jgi:hypothetical protein